LVNFTFLPLVKITGKSELPVTSQFVDRIVVNEDEIKFKLKNSATKEIKLLNFNVNPGINFLQDQNAELPLELMFTTTIDFLERISTKYKLSTIIFNESDVSQINFVETFLFLGDKLYLPFQLRRPSTRSIYSSVYSLQPVKSNIMSPIEVLSDQYEDYLENALYSFLLNVSKPHREKEYEEMIKSQELLKVLDRFEDLSQILSGQIDNIRERYRAFSRIMVPLIQLANLKKKISDSLKLDVGKNSISYHLNYSVEIPSEDLASYIANELKSHQ